MQKLRYGRDCASQCQCQNADSCDNVDGTCNCNAGWMGEKHVVEMSIMKICVEGVERERERVTDGQADKQIHRQTDRHVYRQRDRDRQTKR